MKKKHNDKLDNWTVQDSIELYGIERWGEGLFTADKNGDVILRNQNGGQDINFQELVKEVRMRGFDLPVLIRITDILRNRIKQICGAFQNTMDEYKYKGEYRPVYPIKVNQHRHIIEDIITHGKEFHMGLECGSKAELLLAIAMRQDPDSLIICNGFKDMDYIEIALNARLMGYNIFLVVEKFSELNMILKAAKALKVEPLIGLRMKLATRGKGMWESSGGEKSKFGLRVNEIIEAISILKRQKKISCLKLLHFHIGSQVTDIHSISNAMKEAGTIFTEVYKLGAKLTHVDVGGGLAVDYDGSATNFASSANYNLKEYAANIIDAIMSACDAYEVPHPTIISETGRALVAHHSVLVVDVISTTESHENTTVPPIPKNTSEIVTHMKEVLDGFKGKNFQETYHEAIELRREGLMLFNLRHLSLKDRAIVEEIFWVICRRILNYIRELDYIPDDLEDLEHLFATTYICNFSLFQSLPDHWAVKQLFPIIPLHRLNEKPSRRAVLADITCDSDGVIDRFIDLRDVKDTLPLHPLNKGEAYCLGIFLVGAYQEILGDLHNLFGDTHVVHVSSSKDGYVIDKSVEGERIEDVMEYIQFTRGDLMARFRQRIEEALKRKAISLQDSAMLQRRFDDGLDTYTYLNANRE
ncbi:MAG: biosynthetic arginine decarboxylase [Planctomycetes bacterium]|nr:biosynthetic arginine decarboxylase [Planctomycetota bacterium]